MRSRILTYARLAIAAAGLVFAAVFVARPARADLKLRVHGAARLDVHAARNAGELVLYGTLTDDAGVHIASDAIALRITREKDGEAVALFDPIYKARRCGVSGKDPHPAASGAALLTTDVNGAFCMYAALPVDRFVAHLSWGGNALVDEVKTDAPIDMARQALTLRFAPEVRAIDLDASQITLEAVAAIDEDGMSRPGAGLALTLTKEADRTLATATTNGSGHAVFSIDPKKLGEPGQGEIALTFRGNLDTTSAHHAATIERRTHVLLHLANEDLKAEDPEQGIALDVIASSARGVVTSGSVEARLGDAILGAAPIQDGHAHLVATFSANGEPMMPIDLRYVQAVPWFVSGGDVTVTLPLRGPSPWRRVPLVIAALVVIAWMSFARRRPRLVAKVDERAEAPSEGVEKMEVVNSSRDARAGWSGRVFDAHDARVIRDARVAIERGGFNGAQVLAHVFTNEQGRFEIHSPEAGPGDELVIDAPFHGSMRKPLPAFGELEIALVLRRRRLLDRLVAWARSRGRPYDARPEPTPGHVRRAAVNDFAAAQWAAAVEEAAFGPGEVDARAEAEIEHLYPANNGSPSPSIHPVAPPKRR